MNKRRNAVFYTESSLNGIVYQNKHFSPEMFVKLKKTNTITKIITIYEDLSKEKDDIARYLIYGKDNQILSVEDIETLTV